MAIALPLMVQGISSGSFFIATISILLDGMPQERMPAASGLSNFARIIVAGFSVSLVTTFWDRREAFHQSRHGGHDIRLHARRSTMSCRSLQDLGLSDLAAKAAVTPQHGGPGLSAGLGGHVHRLGLAVPVRRSCWSGSATRRSRTGRHGAIRRLAAD